MIKLYIVVFIGLLIGSVYFRTLVFYLPFVLYYMFVDPFFYIYHKKYNDAPEGKMYCYAAHFGGGKTLSSVQYITHLYHRYNNKKVWDRERKKFVTQKIHIMSNVKFTTVPCEELNAVSQVVNNAMQNKVIDAENNTRTVLIALIDEASSEMNSRSFKDNIDPEFLRVLVTERHYHMNFFYTSQKFEMTDALMRKVTQTCIWCKKDWRFMIQCHYDADQMEKVLDPTMLKPLKRVGWFIRDKNYNEYDTYAIVGKLRKSILDGDMMSEEEILTLRGQINLDMDAVDVSRKFIRRRKKLR